MNSLTQVKPYPKAPKRPDDANPTNVPLLPKSPAKISFFFQHIFELQLKS